MRILPKTNDDVNEEWISDKTRYAYDGLKFQRLTTPLVKRGDRFVAASWEDALTTIAEGLAASGAKGDEIQAVAGHLVDTESLVALKDLISSLGSDNPRPSWWYLRSGKRSGRPIKLPFQLHNTRCRES